jgi:hypothetical protein
MAFSITDPKVAFLLVLFLILVTLAAYVLASGRAGGSVSGRHKVGGDAASAAESQDIMQYAVPVAFTLS